MKIMLIFKLKVYQDLLVNHLEKNGHQPIIATGENAAELYRNYQPDVTLTNLNLTDTLSGIDVIKRIHHIDPQAKIIGVSQFYDRGYLIELQKAKAKGYFTQSIPLPSALKAIAIVNNFGEFWQQHA